MTTSAEVVRRKYAKHLVEFSGGRVEFGGGSGVLPTPAALFALRVALEDLEEVWQDEYASVLERLRRLQGEHGSLQEQADRLQNGLNQVTIENDSWEADNVRLRKQYADSERTYEISRVLAHEARAVRAMIRTHLLPHLVTPHGFLATTHLPEDHWINAKRLLDNEGEPLDEPYISCNLIELASEMFDKLKNEIADLYDERSALEAECLRLRAKTNGSSSATSAEMVLPELAVSSTSKPTAPMHPLPGESSSENGGGAAPASSVSTSLRQAQRPKTQGRSTPAPVAEPVEAREVGETASVDPTQRFDWTTALAGILSSESLQNLDNGTLKWRNLKKSIQTELILEVCRSIHRRIGDLSQTLFDQNRPHWMTSVTSWTLTLNLSWNNVLQTVGVQPNNRPLRMRIGRSVTS